MQGKVVFLLKSRQVDKSTSGQVNEWTSQPVACEKRQSNMVSGQVNK